MTKIYDEFYNLITSRSNYRARGFVNVNCPSCGDRRKRGGFAPTDTGGFRYYCFNGGCDYHDYPTGWEPGNGLMGRTRRLFELFGGNINDIPMSELLVQNNNRYDKKGNLIGRGENLEIATKFPDCNLPKQTDLLCNWMDRNTDARDVVEYLESRCEGLNDEYPFLWSPDYPRFAIIPYLHVGEQIVGYLGRNIDRNVSTGRFIQRCPEDYMFGQHKLSRMNHPYVLVVESPMDAIMLDCVATRGSKITKKQINLLKISGKTPILVPDQCGKEWKNYLHVAETEKWPISIPDWGNHKDPGESIRVNGRLYTIEKIVTQKTTNYTSVKIRLNM